MSYSFEAKEEIIEDEFGAGGGFENILDEDEEEESISISKDNSNDEAEDRSQYKYFCSKCLKRYKRKGHLVEHQKIFCGKEKQECCPYCAFRERLLWDDYQVFNSVILDETIDHQSDRTLKMLRSKQDPLGGRYTCSKCAKSYRWKHHLVEHVKASCGQRKDACCPYCSYRSSRKWNLKSHMKRIHAGA
ncbi:zinc finger X-chromosomal protein-like [Calliopsis andreniformis]|uniref:zinc finger X-chromosomal protein-like n=1 Tax=Calliopsis andreniformis TaxID=337506 RepID=UPI003FCE832A